MDRTAKADLVSTLNGVFNQSAVVVVAHYKGLTVADMQKLRSQMKQAGATVKVAKNSLAGIRTRSTLRSPAAWTAAHRAAARWAWAGFAASGAASAGALLLSGVTAIVFAVIVVVVFIATIVVSLTAAIRAARASAILEG